MYRGQKYQRISLPSYPFDREHYWFLEKSNKEKFNNIDSHPLIGEINKNAKLQNEITIEKTIFNKDLIVKDHQVLGQLVLPGVGYLEIARAAIFQLKGSNEWKLDNMVWLGPMILKEDRKKFYVAVREEDNRLQYKIYSKEGKDLITHFRGEAFKGNPSKEERKEKLSIEDIQLRCSRHLDKQKIYSTFNSVGISYGDYFQGLERVWGNDQEALGLLKLPTKYEDELGNYILHPTLTDSALQASVGLGVVSDNPMLPFAVEKVEILDPDSKHAYSYVKMTGTNKFDVWILDKEGIVCVKIRNVLLRELKPSILDCYVPGWKEEELSAKPLEDQPSIQSERKKILVIYTTESEAINSELLKAYPHDEFIGLSLDKVDKQDFSEYLAKIGKVDMIYFLGGIC
ncbi:polyketide synthase dehydratase domain-containing protein, partial [Priestia megaterium]|uniref:polyketide synthase dehydratase domain-containing protein n=1 Tax=Priestia megaterium TaxID=1404 RepID=UPI0012D96AAF